MTEKEENDIFNEIFSVMAPGQSLRNAVDRIREASLGALIILSDLDEIKEYMEGGFELNTEFSPQKLYELAKMDGAVVVSNDIKKIYGANLQLQPNHQITTDESGTRHRTAHRMALQTGHTVVTVSERRNKITVFKKGFKYSLNSIGDLLIKSSQAIMSLEKYSNIINRYLSNLDYLEYENIVTLDEVIRVIRSFILLFNMESKLKRYILELGTEGITIELQRREIMMGYKISFINLIKDYYNSNKEKAEKVFEKLISIETSIEDDAITKLLGYDFKKISDGIIQSKGYRLLSRVNILTKKDIENIVDEFKDIEDILNSDSNRFEAIKGISKNKANKIFRMCEKYKNIIQLETY